MVERLNMDFYHRFRSIIAISRSRLPDISPKTMSLSRRNSFSIVAPRAPGQRMFDIGAFHEFGQLDIMAPSRPATFGRAG